MTENNQNAETQEDANVPVNTVKIVAEMPSDKEMRENLQEMKENDGGLGACHSLRN